VTPNHVTDQTVLDFAANNYGGSHIVLILIGAEVKFIHTKTIVKFGSIIFCVVYQDANISAL